MREAAHQVFYAHSASELEPSCWHTLRDHLLDVGDLASDFAKGFGGDQLALVAGRLHDLGKYTREFQNRLLGSSKRVEHSTHGARIAIERYGAIGNLLAYVIAGHHAGLANGRSAGERTPLSERLTSNQLPELDLCWLDEIPLPNSLKLPTHFTPYGESAKDGRAREPFQLAFLTRMIFSCLVDADYLDTERFYCEVDGQDNYRTTPSPSLLELNNRLVGYLRQFREDTPVNQLRASILSHAQEQANLKPGLFSLTVPTGGGKTLTSLAFALAHAIKHGLDRVIFVIPFTSIVEQNAAVFRRALGDLGELAVLEHHSAYLEQPPLPTNPEKYQSREKLRLAMENWDVPIVVTTAVQFFESLFAARPSRCRKLHNISNSVVVLDEAQTMPLKLLRPCVAVIDELARNYRTSIVLCTATQPVLEAPAFVGGLPQSQVRELAPDAVKLFEKLERVHVRHIGTANDEQLAEYLRCNNQVLCIVNNRRHARALYQTIADEPGAYHLSTLMCARHRSQVLAQVRQALQSDQACRLVSTSLVEAGVDVDFPLVLRAEAGLDSIAQAAGRCNREGRLQPEESEVLIFRTENPDWDPPVELKQYAQVANEVLRELDESPLAPAAINKYFSRLYWHKGEQALDAYDLLGQLARSRADSLPMEILERQFQMIEDTQVPIIVPWRSSRADREAEDLLRDLNHMEFCGGIARKLQRYLINVPHHVFEILQKARAIIPIAPEKWGNQFMTLAHEGLYDKATGLNWDEPRLIGAEYLNW